MFTDERRQAILKMLEENGRVLAKDLAIEFDLSIDSIRRDLSIMEEQGLIKRTHGGAIPIKNVRNAVSPPALRYGEGTRQQNAIAKAAVSLIQPNYTVFIGGAAIHYVMLQHLPQDMPFTVVTNSIEAAYHLRNRSNVQTYVIGGLVKVSGNITDALANEFANQFTVDLCFATAGAVSVNGLSTTSPEVAIFHKNVFRHSNKIVALVEHEKFGTNLFTAMVPLKKIHMMITDEGVTSEDLETVKSQGVEVLIAENKA